ncbi:FAD synthase [Candidatus Woesearchaeota archaeon]|nr:FAD synthase [Candidatus Woesearchaeota archaeon]
MAFGSFDVLHKGHEHYLKEAKSYGSYLIVVVARDDNILKFKGSKPMHDENYRLKQIKNLKFVDKAILGNKKDILGVIEDHKPDIICLGYDQKTIDKNALINELNKRNLHAKVVRTKPYKEKIYKSSMIKHHFLANLG